MEHKDDKGGSRTLRRVIAAAVLLAFIIFTVALFINVGMPIIDLVSDPKAFKRWIEGYGAMSKGVFAAMMALQVVVAMVPAGPLQVAGGYAFGAFWGTVLALAGNAAGSMLVYGMVRLFGSRAAGLFIAPEKLDKLNFILKKPRWKILFAVIFVIPGSPKDVLTYLTGLSAFKPVTVLLLTSLGRLPAILASCLGGEAISNGDLLRAVIFFAILAVMGTVGVLIYRRLSARHSHAENEKLEKEG